MAKGLNLKAIFSADTTDIKKGSKEAAEAIKSFDSASTDMLNQVAGLFNTNFGQISNVLNAFKGGLLKMNTAFSASTKAAGGTTSALKLLKVALMSTGIGALVVALGSLVAYFTKSQRGAEKLQRILAPFKQIFAILSDIVVKLGEGIVWCFENPKKAISAFLDIIKSQIINRVKALVDSFKALGKVIKGVFTFDWDMIKEGASEYGTAVVQGVTGLDATQQKQALAAIGKAWDENKKKVKEAQQLEKDRQQFQYEELDAQEKMAKLQNQINEARLKSEDREKYSAEERLKFNRQAIALTNQLFGIEKNLAEKRYNFKKRENALSETMFEDLKEERELKMAITEVDTQRNSALKEMTTKNTELLNQVKAQKAEEEKLLLLEKQRAALEGKKKKDLTLVDPSQQENVKNYLDKDIGAEVLIKPTIDIPSLQEAEKIIADFSKEIESALEELITAFAEGIGQMFVGEISFGNVMKNLIKIIASGISKIGQMLISLGVANIALKKVMLNPYTAIAAGAAMVALAAAVTAAIGDTVSSMTGGSNVSASTASGNIVIPLGNTATMSTQSNEIKVTGTLTGDGDKLIAVINNTNNNNKLKY